ncbi:hypothetical protein B0J18DRAFT_177052 [Chaetomium sp. MPI-SDFR-AT-0129]|nr:hypothetical protein B0J18DRAFT_177052 [Chaetomium sp. MPI-SDFR-AT-0129]
MDKSNQQMHRSVDRQPQRRLKDSCDMCSASKVRCNRQKPLCGRCEKLDYPCFYSPARRVGRPQGRNGNPSNSHDTKTSNSKPRPPRKRRNSAATTSTVVATNSPDIDPNLETASSLLPQRHTNPPPKGLNDANTLSKTNTHHNPDRQPPRAAPFQSPPYPKLPHLPNSGLPTPPSARSRQQSRSSEDHHHHHPAINLPASPSPSRICEQTGTDCVSLIMAVQSQLESALTSASVSIPHSRFGSVRAGSVENSRTVIQVASAAMRKLSTILICPCSGRLETGVLISAACLSILDLYGGVVRRSVTNSSPDDGEHLTTADRHGALGGSVAGIGSVGCLKSADGNGGTEGCGCHHHQNDTGNVTVHRNGNEDENENVMAYSPAESPLLFTPQGSSSSSIVRENVNLILVHVLDELAKFAAVVYQFTKRYEGGTGSGSSTLSKEGLMMSSCYSSESEMLILQGLAVLLKKRLKAVGNDTAAQLQADPLRRGTVHAEQAV